MESLTTGKVNITPDKIKLAKTNQQRKELLKEGFIEIAPFITTEDKAEAILKFKTGNTTIFRHMKGDIGRIFFATELYKFMFNRVFKRENLLTA